MDNHRQAAGLGFDAESGWRNGIFLQSEPGYTPPRWPEDSIGQQKMLHVDFVVENLQQAVAHALTCGAVPAPQQFLEGVVVFLIRRDTRSAFSAIRNIFGTRTWKNEFESISAADSSDRHGCGKFIERGSFLPDGESAGSRCCSFPVNVEHRIPHLRPSP